MTDIGDMDPAYPAMMYLCDRFEFNAEQRFWLAFLFAATYCAPTAWYLYNEFPDYEFVDLGRMERFWYANRHRLIFQTDRRWTRSRNQFVGQVASYQAVTGPSQEERFASFLSSTPERTYQNAYHTMMNVKQFGRFSMFLYLEAVHALTGFPMSPPDLDLRNSESSRNGLCYAVGMDELLTGHDYGRKTIPSEFYPVLDFQLDYTLKQVHAAEGEPISDLWNVETSLCAYKKVHRGKRYLGYYIDRQHGEIEAMEQNVTDGVDWSVLWDFRKRHFAPLWRREYRRHHDGDPYPTYRPTDPPHWYRRPEKYE